MADSIYPNGIDGYAQLPLAVDGVTRIDAATVNRLRNTIVKIETELGIKPSGTYIDVRASLDFLEAFPGDLETRVTSLENRADILESTVTSLDGRTTTLESTVISLQGEIDAIENDLANNLVIERINQLYSVTTITTSTLLDDTYGTVLVDATSGNVTVTLPAAANGTMFYRIKKIDTTSNLVIITPQSGETIDGENTFEINYGYDSYSITNTTTDWFNV